MDILTDKFRRLEEIFPECITEKQNSDGEIVKAFDFDKLKEIFSDDTDTPERYQFDWVGKKSAAKFAHTSTDKTLRPCVAESLNFDTTQNLYIEGENLEVLKILQKSYFRKVKMIYIDPPYNTGKDFIYRDNFQMDEDTYNEQIELFDDEENKNFTENLSTNPRVHSDWCSMIYARLLLARNLLTDDGVIFISIDDNEQANLKKICDEVFGERNYQAMITYVRKTSGKQDSRNFAKSTEYIFVYSKSDLWKCKELVAEENVTLRYNKINNEDGRKYRETDLRKTGTGDRREDRPLMWYPFYYDPSTNDLTLENKSGYIEIFPIKPDGTEGRWRWGYETALCNMDKLIARIMPKYKSEEKYTVYELDYMDKRGEIVTVKEHTYWDKKEFNSDNAIQELKNLGFGNQIFAFPKSSALIKHILELATDKDSIVLDFFSGSATTAHAVMELNSEDGGNRKFIMVQLPEVCGENSEAYKAGYKNICEIGKERIRRAGQKINAELFKVDVGFRVLKLDTTNFRDVYFYPEELTQEKLIDCVENIKSDRNDLDLLFGCLLNWGIELTLSYGVEEFEGVKIHRYGDKLIACFDKNISREVFEYIAKKKVNRAVFRDACFNRDADKINAGVIFKFYSPNTKVEVI